MTMPKVEYYHQRVHKENVKMSGHVNVQIENGYVGRHAMLREYTACGSLDLDDCFGVWAIHCHPSSIDKRKVA